MLTPQELKKSPLFQDIGYENYQQDSIIPEYRSRTGNIFSITTDQGNQGQTASHLLLILRMNVISQTNINGHSHTNLVKF